MATINRADHEEQLSTAHSHASEPLVREEEFDVSIGRYPRVKITPEIRRLSDVNGWRTTATIAFEWAVILTAGIAAVWSGHWAVYLLAMFVIGSRQQALGILVHDATHYLLYKNRTVNDFVSDIFCGFPVNISTTLYRSTHFRHHRYINTDGDPDWVLQQADPDWRWPKSRREAIGLFFRCVFAINMRGAFRAAMVWAPGAHMTDPISPAFPVRSRVLFVVSTIIMWSFFLWSGYVVQILILWMVPAFTILNVTNRMRATAEHIKLPNTHELNSSRTITANWFERFLISPLNINYHIEHHMFPSVPGRNLHKLHDTLMQDPEFREKAHIARSYFGRQQSVISELVVPDEQPAAASRGFSGTPGSPQAS
jgi:fatty acid desaturase